MNDARLSTDHVHLRSSDPDEMARFFETMFGAEVARSV
jgi:catechol-2,3-dioxygenase